MQRFTISQNSFLDQPCERCGGKKRMGKSWKETVPIFTTSTVIEYSQIKCVNDDCQEAFEKKLEEEEVKRQQLLLKNKKPAVDMDLRHEDAEDTKKENKNENEKEKKSKKK
jgi:hypothetical protein